MRPAHFILENTPSYQHKIPNPTEIHRPTDLSCRFQLFFFSESYTKLSIPADYRSKVVFVLHPPIRSFCAGPPSAQLLVQSSSIIVQHRLLIRFWGCFLRCKQYRSKPGHRGTIFPQTNTQNTPRTPHHSHHTSHTSHTTTHTSHPNTHTTHTLHTHTRPPICQDPTRSNKINQRIGKHNSTCRCDYSRVV